MWICNRHSSGAYWDQSVHKMPSLLVTKIYQMPPMCIRHSAKGSTHVILFNSPVSSNYVFTKSFLLREMYFPAPLKLDRIMGLSYGQKHVGRSNACHFQSSPLKTLPCSFACTLSLSFFSHWLAGGRGCRGGFFWLMRTSGWREPGFRGGKPFRQADGDYINW